MEYARFSEAITEAAYNHCGHFDIADVQFVKINEKSVEQVLKNWSEWKQDLSHMSPDDRRAYLQGSTSRLQKLVIDGCELVHLYDIQVAKGHPRDKKATIVVSPDGSLAMTSY